LRWPRAAPGAGLLDDSLAQRDRRRVGAVVGVELAEDRADLLFDRRFGQVEAPPDRRVRGALGDLAQDGDLVVGEHLALVAVEGRHQILLRGRRERHAAMGRLVQRADDLLDAGVFEQVVSPLPCNGILGSSRCTCCRRIYRRSPSVLCLGRPDRDGTFKQP